MRNLIDSLLLKNEFVKNVLKVFSGSAVATIIAFIALPIITRLYSPNDYGVYQVMLSFVTLFYSISSLKYEMAIVLPSKFKKSKAIIQLSLFVLLLTTLVFSIALYFGGEFILDLLNKKELKPYAMYLAAGIFLGGMIEIFRYAMIARKQFKHQSISVISQSGTTHGGALVYGYFSPSFFGLFISYVGGQLVFILMYLYKNGLPSDSINTTEIKEVAKEYKKFPLINTFSVFLNRLSLQLPVFMFSAYFTAEVVGNYSLAFKSITLPLTFLSYAVSQVYIKDASVAYEQSSKKLLKLYKSIVSKLSLLGLIPLAVILLFAHQLVDIIFDEEYAEAASFMQIIIFWSYFQFINGSIATTISIMNKQEIGLYLVVFSLVIRFTAMYFFRSDYMEMLYALSISAALFYFLYNLSIYILIKRESSEEDN